MAEYLKQVVFIKDTADKTAKELLEELISNGTLTVGGVTITYDENVLYVTDDDVDLTKLSQLINDGDGTSPFATEDFVNNLVGDIDTLLTDLNSGEGV